MNGTVCVDSLAGVSQGTSFRHGQRAKDSDRGQWVEKCQADITRVQSDHSTSGTDSADYSIRPWPIAEQHERFVNGIPVCSNSLLLKLSVHTVSLGNISAKKDRIIMRRWSSTAEVDHIALPW